MIEFFNNYLEYDGSGYDDPGYDDAEYDDYCSSDYADGTCSHDSLFDPVVTKPIKQREKFKDTKARLCCENHGYIFEDICEVNILYAVQCKNIVSI